MKAPKAMTIRLTAEQADRLQTVADVDESAISAVIRAAITEHIASRRRDRSEEHTSDLQSLMPISYAVFSLTKNHDRTNPLTESHFSQRIILISTKTQTS